MPVTFSSLRVADWDFLEARFIKRCDSGLGGNASSGGRLTLLNANISSIAFYYMSMYLLSKTILARIDKCRRRFFWHVTQNKKRYYPVKWTRICRSKSKGGLGVKDLHKQNLSLLETKSGL